MTKRPGGTRTAAPGRRHVCAAIAASVIAAILAATAGAQAPGDIAAGETAADETAPAIAVPTAPDRHLCGRLDGRYAEALNHLGTRFARCASASQTPVRYPVSACAASGGAVPVDTFADAGCRGLKQAWCRDIARHRRAIAACRNRAMAPDHTHADRAQAEPAQRQRSPGRDRETAKPEKAKSETPKPEIVGRPESGNPMAPLAVLDLPAGPIGQGGREVPPAPTAAATPPAPPDTLAAASLGGCWTASLEHADFREVLTYCLEAAGAVHAEISALGTYRHPQTGETTLFSATCPTGGRYRRESGERFVIESFAASCTWTGRDAVLRRARFAEDTIACTLVTPDMAHCLRRDRSGVATAGPEPLVMTR